VNARQQYLEPRHLHTRTEERQRPDPRAPDAGRRSDAREHLAHRHAADAQVDRLARIDTPVEQHANAARLAKLVESLSQRFLGPGQTHTLFESLMQRPPGRQRLRTACQ